MSKQEYYELPDRKEPGVNLWDQMGGKKFIGEEGFNKNKERVKLFNYFIL